MKRLQPWAFSFAGLLALIVLLAGTLIRDRPSDAPPPPTATTAPAAAVPTATPVQAATTGPPTRPLRVYYARDGIPPLAATAPFTTADDAAARIAARLVYLQQGSGEFGSPAGTVNAVAKIRPRGTPGGDPSWLSFRIEGDLATVEFDVADWGVRGAAETHGLVQQLVYTITDEVGIRRALIREKGRPNAVLDQLVIDKPLAREDVFGYAVAAKTGPVRGFGSRDGSRKARTSWSIDAVAPALARFVISTDQRGVGPNDPYPDFEVELVKNDESLRPDLGKWRLVIRVHGIVDDTTVSGFVGSPLLVVEKTVVAPPQPGAPTVYQLGLEDARPWRTALLFDPVRIVIDVGGSPSTLAASTAVYGPRPGEVVAPMFSVSGVATAFEAHVDWRVRDAKGAVISRYGTTGTNGGEPGGVFETVASVPTSFVGPATLEVFQTSGADGSDAEVVKIPIQIRPTDGITNPPPIPSALFQPSGGPYRSESDAVRQATYLLRETPKSQVLRTTYVTLARQQGIRTYQIDPAREVYLVRVEAPSNGPVKCGSYVQVVDATNGYDRGVLCGEPWTAFGS